MGFFGSLLGGIKKPASDLPPEIKNIFEKITKMMEDEELQNSTYPLQIKSQIVDGLDVDELTNTNGEFGRSEKNPIPVNGPIGELIYLSSLKTQDDQRILYHRIGSINNIDVYETVSIDGTKWDILYFSLYHPRKSRKPPSKYTIATIREQPLLFGTNIHLNNFPYGLQDAIRNTSQEVFGVPMPPPQVRQAEENINFTRPSNHVNRISSLKESVSGFIGAQ
jgi:hypothetical protein